MFYKINKKSNLIFLEKETRDKLENLIKELIKERQITVGVLENEDYLSLELKTAFKKSDITYDQFKALMFDVLESATDISHVNNVVMIDSVIKCYRINDYYFIIRKDKVGGEENVFMRLSGFPPKDYMSIIEYQEGKEKKN